MRIGDTIPCTCLTDAFVKMDDLIRKGYGLELKHGPRGTTIVITEVPDSEMQHC